jgi:hypothetical protein
VTRPALPYALPAPDVPLRVAFVGQRTYFETALLEAPAKGVVPSFVDFRAGDEAEPMLAALAAADPHVVVVFRPDTIPPGALGGVRAPVLGFATEPLPRAGRSGHPELDYHLAELRKADRGNFDRVVCADPLGWEAASELLPTWRCLPLPVADSLYRAPVPSRRPPRIVFIGHPTMHRETALLGLKHQFDLPHYAHALLGDELRRVLAEADVGIALRNDRWLTAFQNVVLLHLAAGHLVLSEPLDPKFGLDAGIHYVEVQDQYDLDLRVHQLVQQPDAYDRVRIRGHHFSRQFAASRVWPRLLRDLLVDLEAFGTERRIGGSTSGPTPVPSLSGSSAPAAGGSTSS